MSFSAYKEKSVVKELGMLPSRATLRSELGHALKTCRSHGTESNSKMSNSSLNLGNTERRSDKDKRLSKAEWSCHWWKPEFYFVLTFDPGNFPCTASPILA
jgi:hypothetical protein